MMVTLTNAPQYAPHSRKAAGELRRWMLSYLQTNRPEPGSRLMTEAELVQTLKISRSTIRRALEPLHREGWIERRAGAGTFVGKRILDLQAGGSRSSPGDEAQTDTLSQLKARRTRGIVRVAVLIYNIGDLAHDWYTPMVLEGLDSLSGEPRVVVELLGDRDGDVNSISRKLELSRPDVLICLSNRPQHAFVIRDAQKLGIQCFVSGTPHLGLNVPAVVEDNRQAVRIAIEHLHQCGHRRIGLAIQSAPERWVMDRQEAFQQTIAHLGLSQCPVHWIPMADPTAGCQESVERLGEFLQRNSTTALIAASYKPMLYVERLHRAGRLSVPDQLSLVSFEQNLDRGHWLDGRKITHIRFPMREMGIMLAEHARSVVAGRSVEQLCTLPATLIEGESVRVLPSAT